MEMGNLFAFLAYEDLRIDTENFQKDISFLFCLNQ